jgi:hypothetical protein
MNKKIPNYTPKELQEKVDEYRTAGTITSDACSTIVSARQGLLYDRQRAPASLSMKSTIDSYAPRIQMKVAEANQAKGAGNEEEYKRLIAEAQQLQKEYTKRYAASVAIETGDVRGVIFEETQDNE